MAYSVNMPEQKSLSDEQLLEFEKRAPLAVGPKDNAIYEELGISPIQYYQRLNRAIENPAMQERYPEITARLHRIRGRRETGEVG